MNQNKNHVLAQRMRLAMVPFIHRVRAILQNNVVVVYLALGLMLVVGWMLRPYSVSLANLSSVLRWSSILGTVAIGQTVVVIAGGIDVSVGMIVFLIYILGAGLMREENALALPVLFICLGIGGGIGLVNGLGVTLARIPPIVMTLGMSTILPGIAWLYSGGITRGGVAPIVKQICQMSLGRYIPFSTVVWLVIALAFILIMRRTTLGRKFYAVGSNPTAAWLSGVDVNLVVILSYIISGMLSAAAGFLLLGYLGMANLRFTDIYTLGSIAAVVVGGTPFFTGIGSIEGTVAGTVIIRFLYNLLIMFQIPEAGRMIANGLIVILVVALYSVRRGR